MPTPKGLTFDTPGVYRIGVQGYLDKSWSDRMNGVDIRVQELPDAAPVTLLTGRFVDQAALAGVLSTLYDWASRCSTSNCLKPSPCERLEPRRPAVPSNANATTRNFVRVHFSDFSVVRRKK